MKQDLWREEVRDAVKEDPFAEFKYDDPTGSHFNFIVEYPEKVNTYKTLSYSEYDDLRDYTVTVVHDKNDVAEVQFRFTGDERVENLEAVPLIHRVLKEDVPARRDFIPEYQLWDNSIVVESPELKPVTLFKHLSVRIWRHVGVYEKEGMYFHEFTQFKGYSSSPKKNPVVKYGEKRLENILLGITVVCPCCDKDAVELMNQPDKSSYMWECTVCSEKYGPKKSFGDICGTAHHLDDREWIEHQFWRLGVEDVYGPSLE